MWFQIVQFYPHSKVFRASAAPFNAIIMKEKARANCVSNLKLVVAKNYENGSREAGDYMAKKVRMQSELILCAATETVQLGLTRCLSARSFRGTILLKKSTF